jgi:hypothetical protein
MPISNLPSGLLSALPRRLSITTTYNKTDYSEVYHIAMDTFYFGIDVY